MSKGREEARALIEIALETYRGEIVPALPKEKRYTGAMIANALGIAERRLGAADGSDELLEAVNAESLEALAKAIRAGDVSQATHPGLAEALLVYVRKELAITNPRFLERREGEKP